MTFGQRQRLARALAAIEDLDRRFHSPRRLEAVLDTVANALRKLADITDHIPKERRAGLYEILTSLAKARDVSRAAAVACRELEDLAETADYDDPDPDDFADECELPVETLLSELSRFVHRLDEKPN